MSLGEKEIDPAATSGVWAIETRSSTYIVDLTENTLLRAPGIGFDHTDKTKTPALHNDSVDIPLIGVKVCKVGENAEFWVRTSDDPERRTWRITTPVVRIEKIG